jgi:hypothetical protein
MSTPLADLFSRNPLDAPHTAEELDQIIAYFRDHRAKQAADDAMRAAKGLPVRKTIKPRSIAQQEERDRKAAVKAAKVAERKRPKVDPRQIDLEEAIAHAR